MPSERKAGKLFFKILPNKYFFISINTKISENIKEGTNMEITYQEIDVGLRSQFQINNIKIINKIIEEKSPNVKCANCENLCSLINFKKCEGIITKYNCNCHCNICQTERSISFIGNGCIRESIICSNCKSIRCI